LSPRHTGRTPNWPSLLPERSDFFGKIVLTL
jgi:hypothetical protein